MIFGNRHRAVNGAIAVGYILVLLLGSVQAQDLDPRRYVNLPTQQNFVRFGFGYSTGEVSLSPGIPFEDAELSMNGISLTYLRSMNFGGKAASFDMSLPRLCAAGSAYLDGERFYRDVCGAGDATVRFVYKFAGAPALALGDFVKREKEIVVGASI